MDRTEHDPRVAVKHRSNTLLLAILVTALTVTVLWPACGGDSPRPAEPVTAAGPAADPYGDVVPGIDGLSDGWTDGIGNRTSD